MTDKEKEYNKAYRTANREKRRLYSLEYNRKNREKLIAKKKAVYYAKILPYYVVYVLPDTHYCGMTNNPQNRMYKHKSMNRNTDDWFVLDICKTKKEALIVEREYHNQGYNGIHPGIKNK
tara:strand:- start:469 stop:828 length:360 start_codon:yes stop_codon:yes gene_type:complete